MIWLFILLICLYFFYQDSKEKSIKIQEQKDRINDLEERICPNNDHHWVVMDEKTEVVDYQSTIIRYQHVKCSRCGKEIFRSLL